MFYFEGLFPFLSQLFTFKMSERGSACSLIEPPVLWPAACRSLSGCFPSCSLGWQVQGPGTSVVMIQGPGTGVVMVQGSGAAVVMVQQWSRLGLCVNLKTGSFKLSPQFTKSADGLSTSHYSQGFYSPAEDAPQKGTAIR